MIRVLSGSAPSRWFGCLMSGSPSDQHGTLGAGPAQAHVPGLLLLVLTLLNEKGNLITALGFLDVSLQILTSKSSKGISQSHRKHSRLPPPSVPPEWVQGGRSTGGCCRPPTRGELLACCLLQHPGKWAPLQEPRRSREKVELVPLPGKAAPMVILGGIGRSSSFWQNALCGV